MRVCLDCYDSLSHSKTEKVDSDFRICDSLKLIISTSQTKESDETNQMGAMGGANDPDSSAEDDSDDDQESKEAHEVSAVRTTLSVSK